MTSTKRPPLEDLVSELEKLTNKIDEKRDNPMQLLGCKRLLIAVILAGLLEPDRYFGEEKIQDWELINPEGVREDRE